MEEGAKGLVDGDLTTPAEAPLQGGTLALGREAPLTHARHHERGKKEKKGEKMEEKGGRKWQGLGQYFKAWLGQGGTPKYLQHDFNVTCGPTLH